MHPALDAQAPSPERGSRSACPGLAAALVCSACSLADLGSVDRERRPRGLPPAAALPDWPVVVRPGAG
eukprot:8884284-Alexandrium_andersonii.AAC.1